MIAPFSYHALNAASVLLGFASCFLTPAPEGVSWETVRPAAFADPDAMDMRLGVGMGKSLDRAYAELDAREPAATVYALTFQEWVKSGDHRKQYHFTEEDFPDVIPDAPCKKVVCPKTAIRLGSGARKRQGHGTQRVRSSLSSQALGKKGSKTARFKSEASGRPKKSVTYMPRQQSVV